MVGFGVVGDSVGNVPPSVGKYVGVPRVGTGLKLNDGETVITDG